MMEYKGYVGKVEIDEEAGILYGEVINVRDVITFEGISGEEVLLLGWGVPMPLPVKSRRYDDRFWAELMGGKEPGSGGVVREDDLLKELGF